MLIVLDCPGCTQRYEFDAALAGKKSRCKYCGEVFQIPVPRAIPSKPLPPSKPSRPTPTLVGGGEWNTVLVEPERTGNPRPHIDSARLGPDGHHFELSPVPEAVRGRRRVGRQEIALQGLRRVVLDSRAEGASGRCDARAS